MQTNKAAMAGLILKLLTVSASSSTGAGLNLVATDTVQYVESPNFGVSLPPMLSEIWTITAGLRQIITLQVCNLSFNLSTEVKYKMMYNFILSLFRFPIILLWMNDVMCLIYSMQQIIELDLPPGASVEVVDGDSLGGPILANLRGRDSRGIYAIMSVSNAMTLYFHTEKHYMGDGFQFSYIEGKIDVPCYENVESFYNVEKMPLKCKLLRCFSTALLN